MQVNILGTTYTINYYDYKDKPCFEERGIAGYHDDTDLEIAIVRLKTHPGFKNETEDYCKKNEKYTLRHEIVHAFLSQSGLNESSLQFEGGWAKNEEMVDWIAYQFPKILQAFTETDCMPGDYLHSMSTSALTRELGKREGVESFAVSPDEHHQYGVTGPAILLKVID